MTFLHPGTVTGPDTDTNYVVIQLDDGDSRDIHIDQVRYLPDNYPIVGRSQPGSSQNLTVLVLLSEADSQDSIRGVFTSRKRGHTASPVQSSPEKRGRTERENKREKYLKNKEKKKKQKDIEWSVSVTEIKENTPSSEAEAEVLAGEDKKNQKSSIAAFLPPQHSLWVWSDPGWRVSSKSRRVFHKTIRKGHSESLEVGDCAVFLSTSRPDRPYIGRIHSMWATAAGNMKVEVRWFYHPAEVEGTALGGGRVEDLYTSNGLFASSHSDENDVQTISHKCHLLELRDFLSRQEAGPEDTEDLYYLAGDYDPVVGTINFKPGVVKT